MKTEAIAIEAYKYFSGLEGNRNIASEYGLISILQIVERFRVNNVLEIGLGIGSVSYSVLRHCKMNNKDITYVGTETNEFCLTALPLYLNAFYENIKIYKGLAAVSGCEKFNMVIIDGQDENLHKIVSLVSRHGIVIIEGDRQPQLELVRSLFPQSVYTRIISNRKHPDYGPFPANGWGGGIQLIFVHPTFSQKLYFWKQRILTSIKYKMRSIKS